MCLWHIPSSNSLFLPFPSNSLSATCLFELIDGIYLIEAGGKAKNAEQLSGKENSYIAVDDIDFPGGKKISL